ncbi:hypothetical protein EAL2_c13640 [Peptoclostridium acidaminophilum DSM 3953]|uniref:Uncharacterized protein n=1 Tax=Peptoclostridium acidaminophilum DSM 3953 TaxID=1286171 RepID=W8T4J8_PEPAC|nr:hypothetical protein [Peptoclostridium acidaminophilum]AHM56659.1 hypothetical protein EAL2_c13640 [Peptoclostridium acidaminophilum DSM 3953]
MDKSKDNDRNVKKASPRLKIILALSFLVAILFAFLIVYIINPEFKVSADNAMKKMPLISSIAGIGDSAQDIEAQKNDLAEYYLSLDEGRVIDKLMLLKKQDKRLYKEIVQLMKDDDFEFTQEVLSEISLKEMKKNALKREIESMKKEKAGDISEKARYYAKVGLLQTVRDIEDDIRMLEIDSTYAASLLQDMKPKYAARVIYYIDVDIKDAVETNLKGDAAQKIKRELLSFEKYIEEMDSMTMLYADKDYNQASLELQDKEKFKAEDVAYIIANMEVVQAGKILACFQDETYANDVIEEINKIKLLNDQIDTGSLYTTVNIMDSYIGRVSELRESYKKMESTALADIIRNILGRDEIYKEYPVGEGVLRITQEELLVDILRGLPPKSISKILKELGAQKASELTRKMGLPEEGGY